MTHLRSHQTPNSVSSEPGAGHSPDLGGQHIVPGLEPDSEPFIADVDFVLAILRCSISDPS